MRARWLRHLSSYEIRLVERKALGKYRDPVTGRDGFFWGECDLQEKVISIRRDLTWIDKIWTLVHELTHAEHPKMAEPDVYDLGYRLFECLSRRSMDALREALDKAKDE